MRRKLGNFLIVLGTLFLLLAAILLGREYYYEYQAGKEIDEILPQLEKEINNTENDTDVSEQVEQSGTMIIDGKRYIGVLSVPSSGLTLPILADYIFEDLNIAPCRYSGTYEKDNMVIGGHNYRRHFSTLRGIKPETEIDFTAVNGTVYKYKVLRVEILNPIQVSDLIDNDDATDWDLTLFTCTMSGSARCVIRCQKISDK